MEASVFLGGRVHERADIIAGLCVLEFFEPVAHAALGDGCGAVGIGCCDGVDGDRCGVWLHAILGTCLSFAHADLLPGDGQRLGQCIHGALLDDNATVLDVDRCIGVGIGGAVWLDGDAECGEVGFLRHANDPDGCASFWVGAQGAAFRLAGEGQLAGCHSDHGFDGSEFVKASAIAGKGSALGQAGGVENRCGPFFLGEFTGDSVPCGGAGVPLPFVLLIAKRFFDGLGAALGWRWQRESAGGLLILLFTAHNQRRQHVGFHAGLEAVPCQAGHLADQRLAHDGVSDSGQGVVGCGFLLGEHGVQECLALGFLHPRGDHGLCGLLSGFPNGGGLAGGFFVVGVGLRRDDRQCLHHGGG